MANGGGYGGRDAARWGKNAKIAKDTAEVDGFARGRVETGVFGMASGSGRRLLQFAGERNDSRSRIQTEHVAVGGVKRIRAIGKRRVGESFKGERSITFAECETFLNSTRDVLEEVGRCIEVCNGWIAGETGKSVDSVGDVRSSLSAEAIEGRCIGLGTHCDYELHRGVRQRGNREGQWWRPQHSR